MECLSQSGMGNETSEYDALASEMEMENETEMGDASVS